MSRREHPRAIRRYEADPSNKLFMRRFDKFMRQFSREEKSEANAVIWDGWDYVFAGGRGLIHKGRKP